MPADTANQESSSPITSMPHQPIMQAMASFHIDGTGFGMSIVSLSLDNDQHLRVYKQSDQANQASIPDEPIVNLAATDVTRVYAILSKILIRTSGRWYMFDLSGAAADLTQLSTSIADALSPGMGASYFVRIKDILAKLPMDEWLDALQQNQFPVKRSGYNEFITKKVLPHLLISFLISILLGIVLIFIWAFVAINGPTWLIYLEYYLSPR